MRAVHQEGSLVENTLTQDNCALQLFRGGNPKGPSCLDFETWYHPEVCHYLLQLVDNKTQCLRVVFNDAGYGNNTQTFKDQLQALILLANHFNQPAVFIAKEPGAENHFVAGLLKANQLLLINPLGITTHQDCYQTLAELQQEKTLSTIYLSTNALQRRNYEGALVSCGPISIEMIMHIIQNWDDNEINNFWKQLKSNEPIYHEKTGLQYVSINLEAFLPESLKNLIKISSKESYQQQVVRIRQEHYQLLENKPQQLAAQRNLSIDSYLQQLKDEAPSQVLFNVLAMKDKNILDLQILPAYSLLKEELKQDLPKTVQQQGTHNIQESNFSSKEKISSLQTAKKNEGVPEHTTGSKENSLKEVFNKDADPKILGLTERAKQAVSSILQEDDDIRIDDLQKLLDLYIYLKKDEMKLFLTKPSTSSDQVGSVFNRLLLQVAQAMKGLSRNDKKSNLIRNKHGKFNWAEQKKFNPSGIDFDMLSHSIDVLEHDSDSKELLEVLSLNADQIKAEFKLMCNKVKNIIQVESQALHKNLANSLNGKYILFLDNIKEVELSDYEEVGESLEVLSHYIEFVYCKILFENSIDLLSKIQDQFSFISAKKLDRKGRYTFAHMMTILGETYKNVPSYLKYQEFSNIFRIVVKTRDSFAHKHHKCIYQESSEVQDKLTPENLRIFVNNTILFINQMLEDLDCKKNIKSISLNPIKISEERIKIFQPLQNITREIGGLFSINSKMHSEPIGLTDKKEKYNEHKDGYKKEKKIVQSDNLPKKIAGLFKKIAGREKELLLLQRPDSDIEKQKYLTKDGDRKHQKTANQVEVEIKKQKEIAEKERDSAIAQYESETGKKFIEKILQDATIAVKPDNNSLQNALNRSASKLAQELPKRTLLHLHSIERECFFLHQLLIENPINFYAMEYSITTIGQAVRDLEDENDERVEQLAPVDCLASMQITKITRNKRMHELLASKKVPLLEIVTKETLPMREEIEAIHKVIDLQQATGQQTSVDIGSLLLVGSAYTVLKKYALAIRSFKEALQICQERMMDLESLVSIYNNLATVFGLLGDQYLDSGNLDLAKQNFRLKVIYLAHACHSLNELINQDPNNEINLIMLQIPSEPEQTIINVLDLNLIDNGKIASLLNNLALTYGKLDEHDSEIKCYKKAIKMACIIRDPIKEAMYLTNLSKYYTTRAMIELGSSESPSDRENLAAVYSLACLWRARIIMEKNKEDNKFFYLNILNGYRKSLQLARNPLYYFHSQEFFVEEKQLLKNIIVRKNSPMVIQFEEINRQDRDMIKYIEQNSSNEKQEYLKNKEEIILSIRAKTIGPLISIYGESSKHLGFQQDIEEINAIAENFQKNSQIIDDFQSKQREGATLFHQEKFTEALKKFKQVYSLISSARPSANDIENCQILKERLLCDLANTCIKLDHKAEAAEYLKLRINLADETGIDDQVITCLKLLANISENPESIITIFLKIDAKCQGEEVQYHDYDELLLRVGMLYNDLRQYDRALEITERLIPILQQVHLLELDEKKDRLTEIICKVVSNFSKDYINKINVFYLEKAVYCKALEQLKKLSKFYQYKNLFQTLFICLIHLEATTYASNKNLEEFQFSNDIIQFSKKIHKDDLVYLENYCWNLGSNLFKNNKNYQSIFVFRIYIFIQKDRVNGGDLDVILFFLAIALMKVEHCSEAKKCFEKVLTTTKNHEWKKRSLGYIEVCDKKIAFQRHKDTDAILIEEKIISLDVLATRCFWIYCSKNNELTASTIATWLHSSDEKKLGTQIPKNKNCFRTEDKAIQVLKDIFEESGLPSQGGFKKAFMFEIAQDISIFINTFQKKSLILNDDYKCLEYTYDRNAKALKPDNFRPPLKFKLSSLKS